MRRPTVVLLLMAVLTVVPVWPAAASCAPDDRDLEQQIADAEQVWKGTVTGTQDGARTAILTIEEVWKGEPADEQVRVLPDTEQPSSTDRTWVEGRSYLVFPRLEEDGEWHDSACSPTREWEATLADARPAQAGSAATGGEEEPEESGAQALVLALIVAGSLALVTVAIRARR